MGECEVRILAVHSGALGDVLLFGRLLEAMDGPVTLVTGGSKAALLRGMGVVTRSLDFDVLPMHEVFADTPLDACKLPGLLGPHERLVSCFAAGNRRAGLRLAAMCRAADAAFLPIRPDEGADAHLLDVWRDMLGLTPAGGAGDGAGQAAPWPVMPAWADDAAAALAGLGIDSAGPYAVIHPGAGAADKCWPLENFLAIAGRIRRPAVFVLGPVELDRWGDRSVDHLRQDVQLLACPPLTTLAAAAAGAEVFIGNDSGPSHLAAAVGAPTIALFGPTRPEQFAPLGRQVITLRAEPISRITVARAAAAAEQLIASPPPLPRRQQA